MSIFGRYKNLSSETNEGVFHILFWIVSTVAALLSYIYFYDVSFNSMIEVILVVSFGIPTILFSLSTGDLFTWVALENTAYTLLYGSLLLGTWIAGSFLLKKYVMKSLDREASTWMNVVRDVLFNLLVIPVTTCIFIWGFILYYLVRSAIFVDLLGVLSARPEAGSKALGIFLLLPSSISLFIFSLVSAFVYNAYIGSDTELGSWFRKTGFNLVTWSSYVLSGLIFFLLLLLIFSTI